jgi:hypothetical protein
MPIVFDTTALVRPRFTPAEFTPTKWDSAEVKANFANKLGQFIAADFKESLFTKVFYNRLSMTYGHIAHFNREGFFGTFFRDLAGKVEFLEQTLQWPCFGDPAWIYCDVERAIQGRLRKCDLLTAYRALRAAEIERRERETLQRLSAKYNGDVARPKTAPVVIPRAASHKHRAPGANAEQATLF